MSRIFLLFPIHLFEKQYLPPKESEIDEYYLIEEPIFFGDREKKMNFNKLKLVLHRASMKYYESYLKQLSTDIVPYVTYVEYPDLKGKKTYPFLKKGQDISHIHIYDPTDRLLLKKLNQIAKSLKAELVVHENPNFLTSTTDLRDYEKLIQGKKKIIHSTFYNWQKKRLDIKPLKGEKSYDQDNRDPIPKSVKIPPLPKSDANTKWVKEAQKYVQTHFPNNYGNTGNQTDLGEFPYPVTHKSSEQWFSHFLKHRLHLFGKYQDAITQRDNFLFHSVITPMLNIGLLQPDHIVDETTKYYEKNKSKVKINNYEGFIRQVIGWREYSRALYLIMYTDIKNNNYFNNRRKLSKKWYTAQTGIQPIDDTIKSAFNNGYLHHILRLMIMCNFMNLCRIHPDEVYQWFMEFSTDSYDWVMTNNVYCMGLYADGGLTMTKPYLSTNRYVEKMSDWKPNKHWDQIWRALYYAFLGDNYSQLKKTAMVRNLNLWDRLSAKEKADFRKTANNFFKSL